MSGQEHQYIPRGMRPYGSVLDVRTRQDETPIAPDWWHEVLRDAARNLSALTQLIRDESHRVDEYQAVSLTGLPGETSVTLTADYDVYPEIIESVIVTGPINTAFNLNLGRRDWSLNTGANGFCVVGPLKLSLDRDDTRSLSTAVAGNWSLELMGYADIRYRVK